MKILRVALDVPLPKLFDYRIEHATEREIGRRVVVPFGNRRVVGIVAAVGDASEVPPDRLRAVHALLDDLPPLPRDWLALARFAADYYQRPLGEVVHAALPPRLRRPEPLPAVPEAFALTADGRAALDALPARSRAKRELLQRLAEGGPSPAAEIGRSAALRECRARGWVAPVPLPAAPVAFVEREALTPPQREAAAAIRGALGGYAPFLLLGVTGSGKTEVYLQVIAAALVRGGQALVLVPEINLTPQLEQEVRDRFPGAAVATLHSALAENERAAAWLAAHAGRTRIVLGTRLAVFTPLPRLAVLIVDEEHDASYKQQEGVRYSARDLAVYRAHAAGIPVVLGSATPSLESYAHARAGRYRLLSLPERAREAARLPTVRLIDTRSERVADGVSEALAAAIEARLARGEQSLVFLNRRGYAPVLVCNACGWTAECVRCSAHLVVHLAERALRCHHCGHAEPVPRSCVLCGNVDLVPFGRGTQRVEAALAARFPAARLLRIDSDSTRAKGRWDAMRSQIHAGEADLLVGTQIMAKGHDFPRLTLVGILNADAALLAADYRAPERLFAQLYQVAGRAGRAELPGEVLVQTRFPQHPLYRALAAHDYVRFAEAQLAERERAGFPPFAFEAVLRAESKALDRALAFLADAARAVRVPAEVTLYDPVPMSVARIGGWARAQLLAQSGSRRELQAFLHAWSAALRERARERGAAGVRWHLEVDPLEF
ncbi:MAG: primosomal protein N' [Burkholderiales bacterium]|nr:primosomal protein N' [Burkholderiales bacterium]